jgi:Fe-Mn family superoxide dismutase
MPFKLMPLPFALDALSPTISSSTVSIHHGKHHRGYVDKLNSLVTGTPLATLSLDDVIAATWAHPDQRKIFNVAGQILNHDLYWKSLTPGGGHRPPERLVRQMEHDFGSLEKFEQKFLDVAGAVFGSGWAWLVTDGEKLDVIPTEGAVTPSVLGLHPLLCVDVWEHAYYLDYQSDRPAHIRAVMAKLANWSFAAEQLDLSDAAAAVPRPHVNAMAAGAAIA